MSEVSVCAFVTSTGFQSKVLVFWSKDAFFKRRRWGCYSTRVEDIGGGGGGGDAPGPHCFWRVFVGVEVNFEIRGIWIDWPILTCFQLDFIFDLHLLLFLLATTWPSEFENGKVLLVFFLEAKCLLIRFGMRHSHRRVFFPLKQIFSTRYTVSNNFWFSLSPSGNKRWILGFFRILG